MYWGMLLLFNRLILLTHLRKLSRSLIKTLLQLKRFILIHYWSWFLVLVLLILSFQKLVLNRRLKRRVCFLVLHLFWRKFILKFFYGFSGMRNNLIQYIFLVNTMLLERRTSRLKGTIFICTFDWSRCFIICQVQWGNSIINLFYSSIRFFLILICVFII